MTHQLLGRNIPEGELLTSGPSFPQTIDECVWMFRRWWRRFAVVFALVMMAGGAVLLTWPVRYTAEALVMVGTRDDNPVLGNVSPKEPQRSGPDIDGAIQLITSIPTLRQVVEELRLEKSTKVPQAPSQRTTAGSGKQTTGLPVSNSQARTGPALRQPGAPVPGGNPADTIARSIQKGLVVKRLGNSMLLKVAYSARDPVYAAEVANAVARSPAINSGLLSHLTLTERTGFDLVKTWVVAPATVPIKPSSPKVRLIGFATFVLALGAALSAILLADYRANRTILSAEQLTSRGVRALGLIPDLGQETSEQPPPAALISGKLRHAFSDSIAGLHASLAPLVPYDPPGCLVLLFASALPFEGKSTTAAALAASIAGSGGRVLLIDADLRSPSLHRIFGMRGDRGVSDCLDDNIDLNSVVQFHPETGVSLLPAGTAHDQPLKVLNSRRLRNAINAWRDSFDFILIDAPPVLPIADPRILAPLADYCVFIARWGKTGWGVINHALQLLIESGARIAGVAVSRVDVGRLATYGFPECEIYGRQYRNARRYLGEPADGSFRNSERV